MKITDSLPISEKGSITLHLAMKGYQIIRVEGKNIELNRRYEDVQTHDYRSGTQCFWECPYGSYRLWGKL